MSQQNVLDIILESTKCLKTIKNRKLKKSKNQDFFKGVGSWVW